MDKIIQLREDDGEYIATKDLIRLGALPDDSVLEGKNVQAIVLAHGHLDHIAAVPRLAERYKCPIIGSPYTVELLKKILRNEKRADLVKYLFTVMPGTTEKISGNMAVEFIHITHSIPHSCMVALHTSEGTVTYLNDYKLDNNPTFGEKPDYKRIKQLAKEGVRLHITECVRVQDEARTPPEYVAKILVQDAIDRAYEDESLVVITTFSSHIVRLRNILEANRGRREVFFMGRSLADHLDVAQRLKLIDLKTSKVCSNRKAIEKTLENIVARKPEKFLLVCTGNQGEPNAVLSRIAKREFKFSFRKEDQVIFSSEVIPNPINQANRFAIERDMREQGVRILRNVHVSGHARREDHRDMIRMLKPEIIIPSHGDMEKLSSFASLASDEGYLLGKTVHVLYDGAVMDIR